MTVFELGTRMLGRVCLRVCLIAMMVAGIGCQHAAAPRPPSNEASFTDLWETYRHCQKSEDPHEMKLDALHLEQTVQRFADDKKVPLIPDELEQLVLDRPTRLAVDPKAMVASCALLAGYQARVAGEPRLAAEMFGHILSNYSSSRYHYYVVQAYHGLKAIAGDGEPLLKQFIPPGVDPGS